MSGEPRGHVALRDVTAADLPVLWAQQQDPEANRLAGVPARDWPEFEAHFTRILADPGIRELAIELDGELAGHVVCFERGGLREVGYWIGKDYRGRGVATRALAAFLADVRERPLHARVSRANAASIRVLEKFGFTLVPEEAPPGADDAGLLFVLPR